MIENPFDFNEFVREEPTQPEADEVEGVNTDGDDEGDTVEADELDVQKAVVEELAAEKLALHEKVIGKVADLQALQAKYNALEKTLEATKTDCAAQLAAKDDEIAKLTAQLENFQERNPNALALLDREVELPDRFPGETRDHVLEVIQAARVQAEADGRVRRAQVLEGVLVANEPNGSLAQKRAELEKLFIENANVINGTVIAELEKWGLSHKKGEEYLLPSEILLRSY